MGKLDRGIRQGKVLHPDVFAAGMEAENLLENAREQADAIISVAEQKAREICDQAYKDGYDSGVADCTEAVLRANRIQAEQEDAHAGIIADYALEVASKLTCDQFTQSPENVLKRVNELLQRVRRQRSIQVHVSSTDFQTCHDGMGKLKKMLMYPDELSFVDNPELAAGDCRIVTEAGVLDARLTVQLKRLKKILINLHQSSEDNEEIANE